MNLLKLLLLLSLLQATAQANEQTIAIAAEQFKNLGVVLGKLEPSKQLPLLYAPATVTIPPSQEYIVSAAQPGLITQLQVAVGDQVKKGQVLAQINSPALLSLQGQYLKSGSALKLAAATYNRDKKLLKDGVIANRREQETLAQYTAAALDAKEVKQLLEIAGMGSAEIQQLDSSQKLHSTLTIRAPHAGVVIERMAVAGTRIDSMAPLYRIANLDELWLEIAVPQERVQHIKLGDQVQIENSQHQAVITLLGQSVNTENQTVQARAVIKGHAAGVRVGQKVNIQIIQPSTQALYKIPNTAIAQNEGKAYVFMRTPTGFTAQAISVVGKQGEESIITGALSGDEHIAVKGVVALKANWLGLGRDE
ncbi:MAG: efflux RND transporter periplasmic adaptor subunit [Methylococcales bacterium]